MSNNDSKRKSVTEDASVPAVLPQAPADRIRVVTWEGHEYAIDPMLLDDVEVLEYMADMEEQPFLLVALVRRLLGDEPRKNDDGTERLSQWKEFKQNHRDEQGRFTVERLGQFMEVLNKELAALGN